MNKNKIALFLVVVTLTTTFFLSCNNTKTTEVNKNYFGIERDARVVYVGNSITHMGMFHNNILLYHVTRFPEKDIKMFNCGVSGDVTWGVLDRMEEDILIHKPTQAVIMLGMNDVGREWYGTVPTSDPDTLKQREKRLQDYKENMEKIVNIFLDKGIKVILERPSIYDQTAALSEKNHLGVNDALRTCAVYCDSLAQKYNLQKVDYFTVMNDINTKTQKKDPSFTLTGQDRIHPGETGHFVMFYEFLKSEKAPKYVSQIVINSKNKSANGSKNCEVKDISSDKNGTNFSVKEKALPFPVKEDQKEGLSLVPFMKDFNVELLRVAGLNPETKYQLKIDDEQIGRFTSKQLDEGINLAGYSNTPQYKQSKKVLEVLQELWKAEGKLRGMKFIEYLPQYKKMKNTNNPKVIEAFMNSAFVADGYTDPYYKSQLKKFLKNKPREEKYKEDCKNLIEKAYSVAQPEEHTFEITVLN